MRVSAAMRRIHLSDLIMASRAGERGGRSALPLLSCLPLLPILDDYIRKLPREVLGLLRHEDGSLARDLLVDRGDLAVGVGDNGRTSRVGLLPNADIERQAAEKRHVVVLAHALGGLPLDIRIREQAD